MRRLIAAALAAALGIIPISSAAAATLPLSPVLPPPGVVVKAPSKPSIAPHADIAPPFEGEAGILGTAVDMSVDVTAQVAAAAPTDAYAADSADAGHLTDAASAASLSTGVLPDRKGDGTNRITFTYFDDGDIAVLQDPWQIGGHAGLFDRRYYTANLFSYAMISANVKPVRGVQREQCVKYRAYDRAYGLYVPSVGSGAFRARDFAARQIGKPYDLGASKWQTSRYYCSLLVWASYWYTYQIDLDGDRGYWVWPSDLLTSKATKVFGIWD
ncbi:MAG: hypothetical protein Q7W30_09990 [Coriobacteriia bacterium]|nr:hypothetical protein [Coriobacteriia bacterium]